jgi:ribosomal protein S3
VREQARRRDNGSEDQSHRAAPRHQPDLGLAAGSRKAEYGKLLHEDLKIREILHRRSSSRRRLRIVIERPHKKCRVTIHTARPGVVIGKKGADIDKLRKKVANITSSDV